MPLITFEGADGAGKSTQVAELARRLAERGIPMTVLREPGGTDLGERVRAILKDPGVAIGPITEMLLFSAARSELVRTRIAPVLERGELVILDRFTDSTLAYQGCGRGIGEDVVHEVNRIASGGLTPTLTFYLDLSDELRVERIGGTGRDRIEMAGDDFYLRVVRAYRAIAMREPQRVVRIDADRPVCDISDEILDTLVRRGLIRATTAP